jgi:plastocyanin
MTMRLGITATLLACVAGAGVAVGALTLEPPAAPATAATAQANAPAGTDQDQHGAPAHGQPGGYGSARGAAGGGAGAAGGQADASAQDGAGQAGSSGGAAAGGTLEINGFQFSAIQVAPGATVTVINRDSVPHTATARDGGFDTGSIERGGTRSFTAPAAPGSYEFFCAIHPSMTGTLTVG